MDTAPFKVALETEKTTLEAQLATVGRRNPSNPNDWEPIPQSTGLESDLLDTAEQIEGFEDNTAILKELEIRYNEVLAALARIDAGSYGVCEVGGETISEARLEANPAATTCVEHT